MKTTKPRNFHKLSIIKREARGNTTSIPSKKIYKRRKKHIKHKGQ